MADNMTKDEILNALGEISKHFEDCAKLSHGSLRELFDRWMNAADWAAAYLNDPAPTSGSWIRVDGSFDPPHDKPYAIIFRYRRLGKVGYKTGVLTLENEEHFLSNHLGCITHWMPLPELPKEALSEDAK